MIILLFAMGFGNFTGKTKAAFLLTVTGHEAVSFVKVTVVLPRR